MADFIKVYLWYNFHQFWRASIFLLFSLFGSKTILKRVWCQFENIKRYTHAGTLHQCIQPWQLSSLNKFFIFFKTLQVDIGNSVPFNIVPSRNNALGPAPLRMPKTVFNSSCVSCFSACVITHSISSTLPQWTFSNVFLTFGSHTGPYLANIESVTSGLFHFSLTSRPQHATYCRDGVLSWTVNGKQFRPNAGNTST